MKDLLSPNTITGQKDEKPHPAGLDDTKIMLEKKLNAAIPETPMSPSVAGRAVVAWGKKRYTVGGLERGKQGVFPSLTFALFELDPLICLYHD